MFKKRFQFFCLAYIICNFITGSILNAQTAKWGQSELHIAAYNGDVEEVMRLLQTGADVNAKDDYGVTPLGRAIHVSTNVNVLEYLIAQGADVNTKNNGGGTPLHCAAATISNIDILKCLVEHGANVNAKNYNGETPLHYAVIGNPDIWVLKYLIEQGANVNAKDLAVANTEEKKRILSKSMSLTDPTQYSYYQEEERKREQEQQRQKRDRELLTMTILVLVIILAVIFIIPISLYGFDEGIIVAFKILGVILLVFIIFALFMELENNKSKKNNRRY